MWKTVKLGDVCEIQPKKAQAKKKLVDTDTISFMPMQDLGINEMYPTANQKKTLAKAYSSYTYFEDNDVLLAKITPCFENGKLGIASNLMNGVGFGSSEYIVLRCGEEVLPQYIYYHLNQPSFRAEGKAQMRGAVGHKRVPIDFVENLEIPLPPLAEQERIVAKLDAVFAEIDEAIETTSESLKSIQQLFLTSLDTLVNADDLGELKALGEICELAQGLAINKGTKHLLVRNSYKPLIRIKDLVNETEEQFITDEYENTKTEVNEEDLIFTRTGSLGLVFRGRKGVLHNNSFKVTPSQGLSRDYLYWWLKNPSFLDIIHRISGKAAQPDISHKLFKAQQIKIPTAAKQKDMVAKIELLFEQTEKMKRINSFKLHQIHVLKSAMLSQELQSSEAA